MRPGCGQHRTQTLFGYCTTTLPMLCIVRGLYLASTMAVIVGTLLYYIHCQLHPCSMTQETFLFNLDAYVQRNGQENALQGGSQQGARGSREAQAQQGEEVELWASAAEGAPFLVVQAEGEDGEGELRVVEELGEEQLGNLLQAEVKEKMTLGPSAMKSLIGRYWAYVVYSRWALGKGEELLGQLGARLQLHAAAAGAGVPGGEEAVEEEGAPDHVAAAGVGVPLAEEAVEVEGALGPAAAAVLQPELLGQRQPQGTADSRNATRDELLRAAPAVQLREVSGCMQ